MLHPVAVAVNTLKSSLYVWAASNGWKCCWLEVLNSIRVLPRECCRVSFCLNLAGFVTIAYLLKCFSYHFKPSRDVFLLAGVCSWVILYFCARAVAIGSLEKLWWQSYFQYQRMKNNWESVKNSCCVGPAEQCATPAFLQEHLAGN